MRCLFLLAITLATFSVSMCQAGPVIQWSGPGSTGHYYQATDVASTWTSADALATSLGGYLVSVTSADEQSFLATTFFSGPDEAIAYWIGFTDQSVEGTFAWTSGEAVSYTNWLSGEPNDATGGVAAPTGEDYVVMNWGFANGIGGYSGWNDAPNGGTTPGGTAFQPYRAIIEYDTDPRDVPEPGSLTLLVFGSLSAFARWRRKDR